MLMADGDWRGASDFVFTGGEGDASYRLDFEVYVFSSVCLLQTCMRITKLSYHELVQRTRSNRAYNKIHTHGSCFPRHCSARIFEANVFV